MAKNIKQMKKILILGLCTAISLVGAISARATTITLTGNYGSLPRYAGEYVGPMGGTLNSTTDISGGIACVDIALFSYFGSTWGVNISTLQNMTNARHGSDAAAVFRYEEAAWLLGQIPVHATATQVGEIQFAVWKLFDPVNADNKLTSASGDIAAVDSWLALAATIDPQNHDFSSVRIYTPLPGDGNQEWMSGVARNFNGNPTPIPAGFVLLGTGLLALAVLSRRKKAVLVPGDKK
jgi:hypothetical protein